MEEVSPEFEGQFRGVSQLPPSEKQEGYAALLDKLIDNGKRLETNLKAYLSAIIGTPTTTNSEPMSVGATRLLLTSFVKRLPDVKDNDAKVSIIQYALSLIEPRVVQFEEADSAFKYALADTYESEGDFISSARALQRISLDTSSRGPVPDSEKADLWVRIARCYLEEDDSVSASGYINRAKNVLHNVDSTKTRILFQLTQARVLDSQRQFLDASNAFHNISYDSNVDEEDRMRCLSAAISCAVLAPAGPHRARILAKIYKDDRAVQVPEYSILEKIFLDRILSPEEVSAFSAKLQPHQLARTSDGSTVLDRAVLEHNLIGISRLYQNIGINRLGQLLGVDEDRAERSTARMIEQGRLAGHIDQIDQLIFFEGQGSGERMKTGGQVPSGSGGQELRKWDMNVQGLAEEVEKVTSMIQTQYPVCYDVHIYGKKTTANSDRNSIRQT